MARLRELSVGPLLSERIASIMRAFQSRTTSAREDDTKMTNDKKMTVGNLNFRIRGMVIRQLFVAAVHSELKSCLNPAHSFGWIGDQPQSKSFFQCHRLKKKKPL